MGGKSGGGDGRRGSGNSVSGVGSCCEFRGGGRGGGGGGGA